MHRRRFAVLLGAGASYGAWDDHVSTPPLGDSLFDCLVARLPTYMGHANIRITLDTYGHLMPGNEDEAAGLLDAYLARTSGANRGANETETAYERHIRRLCRYVPHLGAGWALWARWLGYAVLSAGEPLKTVYKAACGGYRQLCNFA